MISLSDLFAVRTADEVKAEVYALADSLGLSTTAWQALSPMRTLMGIVSNLFAGYSKTQAAANKGAFLDTAEGNWLTMLARYVYGVERIEGTFASGHVTVSNAGGGLYSFGIGDLVVRAPAPINKTYANTAPVTVLPLAAAVVVPIQAQELGASSNAAPGQITEFVAAAPQLSVTNTVAVVGYDEETDASLRQRCLDKLGALSPGGASSAYAYVAKTEALNGGVACNRALVVPATGTGLVSVVVASPAGQVPGAPLNPATALGKIYAALVSQVVPAGYSLSLSSALVHLVSANATLYVSTSSGLSNAEAIAKASTAAAEFIAEVPIGGVDVGGLSGVLLFRALEAAMKASASGILQVKLAIEADIPLAYNEIAVLNGAPVLNVVQVVA